MSVTLRFRPASWQSRRRGVETGPVTLTQRRVYILPTGAGLLFAGTVLVMLLGCINYNLGLGYVLMFLLSGVGIVSILHTFRNLAQLQVRPGRPDPVFAGDDAGFPVLLVNGGGLARFSVGLTVAQLEPLYVDVPPRQTSIATLRVPTQRRGRLPLGRIRVFTTFPLGLFVAWSNVALDLHCLVFPRPESGRVPLPEPRPGDTEGLEMKQGQDDFAGLRKYQPGDSLRHVAWKAVARGQAVMTKQFSGLAAGELWLDWGSLPHDLLVEARLSRLTRWVLEATRAGHTFGLRLPTVVIAPGAGPAHQEQCLTALALFDA
jgi:uncharacterized protein (DUF58 family)